VTADSRGLRLLAPSPARLTQYEAALAAGWSPDTERDVSAVQLAALRRDPGAFLAELTRQDGMIVSASGRVVPRLPSRVYWLDDGEFCGVIDLRFVPGSDALPEYVSGHIGYAVVPWKRRRGYATGALALLLPVAREVGLTRVEVAIAFLALLELRKQDEIAIAQASPFAPIRISRADAERSLSWNVRSA